MHLRLRLSSSSGAGVLPWNDQAGLSSDSGLSGGGRGCEGVVLAGREEGCGWGGVGEGEEGEEEDGEGGWGAHDVLLLLFAWRVLWLVCGVWRVAER